MKQCPVCKTTYTDDSLKFCLADGAGLISVPEPEETVQMSFDKEPMNVNIPADSFPTVFGRANTSNQNERKAISPLIIAALLGLLLLIIVGIAGIGGYFLLKSGDNKNSSIAEKSPTLELTPTAKPEKDETAELKEKLANLQQQVEEQKKQKKNTQGETFPTPLQTGTTARVYTPGDGFLALRSDPDAELGYRITTIPHGTTIKVTDCLSYSYVGKKRGRWCRTTYDGYDGWIFDAYLIY